MKRRLPNLKQLRAFDAAARLSSFRDAAEELGVTQAAVSHQIKGLEEHLGRRLFDRLNRKVALRQDARSLAAEVAASLGRIEAAVSRYQEQELTGRIRISVTPFYANRMVLPYLHEFLALYPEISVEFDYSYKIADFEADEVDAAIRYGLSNRTGEHLIPIHKDRVAPVASPRLLEDARTPLSATQIATYPLAAVSGQERYWAQWFEAAGIVIPATVVMTRHEQRALALDYALAGNAIALADLPLIRTELATGSLIRLSETEIELDRGIHLATPAGPFEDRRLNAFADWLKSRVAMLDGRFSSR